MAEPLTICIGYDRGEKVAFNVLAHSLISRSSRTLKIIPLYRPALEAEGLYWRKREPNESTEFSFSRFLTPYLAGGGISVFMDCDMLCLTDIAELVTDLSTDRLFDVAVVKHNYVPQNVTKFLGNQQSTYPRKLWSAMMVFNGQSQACKNLTPNYVNTATGAQLHQFEWIRDEARLWEIPEAWQFIPNHSKGEPKLIHWTEGGPWFDNYQSVPFADKWQTELIEATHA